MLIKAGVAISKLRPEIRKKLPVIARELSANGVELIITSTYEGSHSEGSLHYANLAIDIRVPKKDINYLCPLLAKELNKDYDIVSEPSHIHIEYDPKQ